MAKARKFPQDKVKKIAWGESADVYLLPKTMAKKGGRVVRIERRYFGKKTKLGPKAGIIAFNEMRLAHLLFPKNVIKMTAVQVKHLPLFQAFTPRYYSKHYPLPAKIKQEALHIKNLIKQAHKGNATGVLAEVKAFDKKARAMFPDLVPTAKKMAKAGVVVPHPELNFTVHKGKIMFYEAEIDFRRGIKEDLLRLLTNKAVSNAKKMTKKDARKFFVEFYKTLCERSLAVNKNRISGNLSSELIELGSRFEREGIISREEREKFIGFGYSLYSGRNNAAMIKNVLAKMKFHKY